MIDVGDTVMLVTKIAKPVTNTLKLSPTHFVSNIRHQHRCYRFVLQDFYLRSMIFKNSDDIEPIEDLSILSKEGLENRKIMQQLFQDRLTSLPKIVGQ